MLSGQMILALRLSVLTTVILMCVPAFSEGHPEQDFRLEIDEEMSPCPWHRLHAHMLDDRAWPLALSGKLSDIIWTSNADDTALDSGEPSLISNAVWNSGNVASSVEWLDGRIEVNNLGPRQYAAVHQRLYMHPNIRSGHLSTDDFSRVPTATYLGYLPRIGESSVGSGTFACLTIVDEENLDRALRLAVEIRVRRTGQAYATTYEFRNETDRAVELYISALGDSVALGDSFRKIPSGESFSLSSEGVDPPRRAWLEAKLRGTLGDGIRDAEEVTFTGIIAGYVE